MVSVLRFVIVALALTVISACSGAGPTGPGPIDPGPNPGPNPGPSLNIPWSQLPAISDKAKQIVVDFNLNISFSGGPKGSVKAWKLPIPVYGEPGIIGDHLPRAINLWRSQMRKDPFRIVGSREEAKIVLDNVWPPPPDEAGVHGAQACAVAGARRLENGAVLEGFAHFGFLVKPAICPTFTEGIIGVILHELGHGLMIYGHPDTNDIMSVTNKLSLDYIAPETAEAVDWIHDERVPQGVRPQ